MNNNKNSCNYFSKTLVVVVAFFSIHANKFHSQKVANAIVLNEFMARGKSHTQWFIANKFLSLQQKCIIITFIDSINKIYFIRNNFERCEYGLLYVRDMEVSGKNQTHWWIDRLTELLNAKTYNTCFLYVGHFRLLSDSEKKCTAVV